jgi:hypothetical protein
MIKITGSGYRKGFFSEVFAHNFQKQNFDVLGCDRVRPLSSVHFPLVPVLQGSRVAVVLPEEMTVRQYVDVRQEISLNLFSFQVELFIFTTDGESIFFLEKR